MLDKADYVYLGAIIVIGVVFIVVAWAAIAMSVENETVIFMRECQALEISVDQCAALAEKVIE